MSKARVVNIVCTECKPEDAEQFNKWYNEVHIPMLMKYKGIKKVTRYTSIQNEGKPRYLAIYEFDKKADMDNMQSTQAFKDAIEEMNETWKGNMPDIKWVAAGEPIKVFE